MLTTLLTKGRKHTNQSDKKCTWSLHKAIKPRNPRIFQGTVLLSTLFPASTWSTCMNYLAILSRNLPYWCLQVTFATRARPDSFGEAAASAWLVPSGAFEGLRRWNWPQSQARKGEYLVATFGENDQFCEKQRRGQMIKQWIKHGSFQTSEWRSPLSGLWLSLPAYGKGTTVA